MERIASREIFWNVESRELLYLLSCAAAAVFLFGMYRKYSVWRQGQPAGRNDRLWYRTMSTMAFVFAQGRILRRRRAGLTHLLVFWGMAVLFAGTIIVALQAHWEVKLLQGRLYPWFKLAMDLAGTGMLVGLLAAIDRRYRRREQGLDSRAEDGIVLALPAGIAVTGFIVESLRIAATQDPWGGWAPVGNAIAHLLRGAASGKLNRAHEIAWLAHSSLALGFIGYIPFSRLIHVVAAPLTTFFRPLGQKGVLTPLDLENEGIRRFGVGAIDDFTWKDLLDTDACVLCGRCQDNCPAHVTGKPLSPGKLIRNLKAQATEKGRMISGDGFVGDLIEEDALWACTTCGSCAEQCPVFVEHVPKFVGLRRRRVLMESKFPTELIPVFRNMESSGNPWGIGRTKRADWCSGLDVKVVSKDGPPEYLFWTGCAGSFDDRNRRVAVAMSGIMSRAGVDFAILGPEENCCGESARRLGNEYLFQSLARENIDTLYGYGIKKVITHCPHCFHALKNEYPQLGGRFEVIHHTEWLARCIETGRIEVKKEARGPVTYQDPCYLGRYNDGYRAPREILKALGFRLTEMPASSRESFCCGAGGGRMWLEERIGERINVRRSGDALGTAAESIATACPFCLTMMEDGVKLKDPSERIRTVDVAELVVEAVR
ncbi:MAG: 4Fe-4S dicluster domain-containing protein [Deltaproteobacteria bacterium]|nr:4Fe-4S dicluster domain-containing protein [Deltaproteobacteria bacterium]